MSTLTVLTLVPNAGDRLKPCLESVRWADDIFCVVDKNTNDGSKEVAESYSKHVVVHEYVNAANQRNWALPQINTEWTLVLDADEWLSDELIAKIKKIIQDPSSKDGYKIKRMSYFFGKLIRHCGWHRDYNVRLFRTKKGRYLEQRVHSRVLVEGSMGVIDEVMYHDTYRNFEEYFATSNRFTNWGAMDAYEKGKRTGFLDITLRPIHRFIKMYLIRGGFLDGFHGAVLCGLAANAVFLKYAKIWNLERLEREKAQEGAGT